MLSLGGVLGNALALLRVRFRLPIGNGGLEPLFLLPLSASVQGLVIYGDQFLVL